MARRKLAEVWDENGDYHLRVEVGAFQRQFTGDPRTAEDIASFEVIEVLRKIVAEADAERLEHRVELDDDKSR
jgi:hypothetical protein